MDRKTERLLKRTEKVGVRLCRKSGHLPDETELRSLKVQILPNSFRWLLALLGGGCGAVSYYCFTHEMANHGVWLGIAGVLLLSFAFYGVRRTLGRIVDSMDVIDAAWLMGKAVEKIKDAATSAIDV